MRPIVTTVAHSVVCVFLFSLGTSASPAKTDETIEMLFESDSCWSKESSIRWGAHWRQLAYIIT